MSYLELGETHYLWPVVSTDKEVVNGREHHCTCTPGHLVFYQANTSLVVIKEGCNGMSNAQF